MGGNWHQVGISITNAVSASHECIPCIYTLYSTMEWSKMCIPVFMHYIVQWNEAKYVLSWSWRGNGMLNTFITNDQPRGAASHERIPCGYVLHHTTEWRKTWIKSKLKGQWDAQYFNQRPTTWNMFMWCGSHITWTYSVQLWAMSYNRMKQNTY